MRNRICHKLKGLSSSSEIAGEDEIVVIEYSEQGNEVLFIYSFINMFQEHLTFSGDEDHSFFVQSLVMNL